MASNYKQYALPVGTMVQEYRIINILGSGGFGIVYKAENKYFSEIVALKEFLPVNLAYRDTENSKIFPLSPETEKAFQWTRHKFLQEAKTLRELGYPRQHPNIVKVRQFIEANDTAYMVMDFEEGLPLSQILSKHGTIGEKKLTPLLHALLDGLECVHKASVWHRDIKPSNILIRSDGSPVLIDFGAARRDISGSNQSIIRTLTPAYAAVEQIFPIGRHGPWTDIYSMGATIYRAVTGKKPVLASERLQGKAYVSAADAAKTVYTPYFLAAIDAALGLYPEDRPQSIGQWKALFTSQQIAAIQSSEPTPENEEDGEKTQAFIAAENPGRIDSIKKRRSLSQKAGRYVLPAVLVLVIAFGAGLMINRRFHSAAVFNHNRTVTKKIEIPAPQKTAITYTQINIQSSPAGARVFINGNFKGRTPIKTDVGSGVHSLYVGLEGYYDWKANLRVEEEGEIPLRISLLKR